MKMDESVRGLARFSAYLSLILSASVTALLIGIIFLLCSYLIKGNNLHIEKDIYFKSLNSIVVILMAGEIFKFGWLCINFREEIEFLKVSASLQSDILALPSIRATMIIQIVFTVCSGLAMYLTLKYHKISYKDRLLVSITMTVLLILYSSLYLLK
ncbi:hypothetical protein [Pedobacter aquatilis]|uniref:hypothetical protein n=1 Tax=Pedobacter aquatilis TaxID=351343 RepID=UPI00292CC0C9|nr:hypothetical protein [Pedobacter aquatilis]